MGTLVVRVNGPICFANVELIKECLAQRKVCNCNAVHCSSLCPRQIPIVVYFLLAQQHYHPRPHTSVSNPPLPPQPPHLSHPLVIVLLTSKLPLTFHCPSLPTVICTVRWPAYHSFLVFLVFISTALLLFCLVYCPAIFTLVSTPLLEEAVHCPLPGLIPALLPVLFIGLHTRLSELDADQISKA